MTNGHQVRISFFEPVQLYRECLQALLATGGLTVVASYRDAAGFLAALSVDRPDVALADLGPCARGPGADLERVSGLVREVRDLHALPLVVLAGASQPDPESCYREGAAAYFDLDRGSGDELVQAVRAAASGVRLFPSSLAQVRLAPGLPASTPTSLLSRLSLRERQVLRLIGSGADNLKIAAQLGISERTVKAHVTGLYRKSQVENRTQLAILARELGLRPWTEPSA